MNKIQTYKDLIVWQKAMDLVIAVYDLTKRFPNDERYGLISQMKRAVTSIPSNIAEGRARNTRKDYEKFAVIAYSSGAELETQLEITKRLKLADANQIKESESLLTEVMKMLNKMTASLKTQPNT